MLREMVYYFICQKKDKQVLPCYKSYFYTISIIWFEFFYVTNSVWNIIYRHILVTLVCLLCHEWILILYIHSNHYCVNETKVPLWCKKTHSDISFLQVDVKFLPNEKENTKIWLLEFIHHEAPETVVFRGFKFRL